MQDEDPEACPRRELIEAFAHDELDDAERREAERVLEESEPCRELFRQLTAGRYPRLPNYTIIGQVGKGGFGVVYKAIHHAKERTEALKVLFSKTPLLTEYFENEVHLIARLRHPNIATLYEAQLSTPPLYYTMEFVEGERLNDSFKRHEVSLVARIDVIKTVAQAVGYAHEQGVVHRDLKPQNVLLDPEGQAHIVDFGIAKKLAEARPSAAQSAAKKDHEGPVGTLGYIAPEQEKGGLVDGRADVYALGALLFHSVTGEPARLAGVPDQRMRILRERQVAQPEDLAAIIARCVEESPDKRYGGCAEFVADLDNYLTGRPIMARGAASWAYQAARIGTLVMRESPVTVRTAVLILVTAVLTWYLSAMETHVAGGGGRGDQTVMIGLTDSDIQAISEGRLGADLPGLSKYNIRSWRMLYGQMMERLAEASPRVILVDSYLEQCSPFDEYFVRGLRASTAPVVVAALKFDINGEPIMCEKIREEIDGYGTILGGDVRKHPNKYEVTYCIQRGFVPPIPGLALAAFAATRFRDCEPQLKLNAQKLRLQIRYRKRHPKPGESRFEKTTDERPLHHVGTAKDEEGEALKHCVTKGYLEENDKVADALVPVRPDEYWSSQNRTISFEQVLTADTQQLKHWFDERAVVIGQMRHGVDQRKRANDEMMFGCQLHAEAIDALLAGTQTRRFTRVELAARTGFWCGVAVLLVSLQGRRRWRSLRQVTLVCCVLFTVGLAIGGTAGIRISERWLLEVLVATTGLLTAGSLTFWTKAVRERQLGLTPSAVTLASEGPTLGSTVLAETR